MRSIEQADEIVRIAQGRARKLARAGYAVRPGKAVRNHPKRHGVNRRRSQQARDRRAIGQKKAAAWLTRKRRAAAIMRAYYAGEIPDLRAHSPQTGPVSLREGSNTDTTTKDSL